MGHLFCGRLTTKYFVFFGPECLKIYLLLAEWLLVVQEGLCTMKLVMYYVCIFKYIIAYVMMEAVKASSQFFQQM
jgi:hypothetical protein